MKDGFSIEERDDERTISGELTPDCEKPFEESVDLPIIEYIGEFKALIDACGQVSYFFNMRNFVSAGVNKAKVVASAYHHDLRYYQDQLDEWRAKARRSFAVLCLHAKKFGFSMPSSENGYLNMLAVSKDRRDSYKGYLTTCLKNSKALSFAELEVKFQVRLKKALNKPKKS